MDIVNYDAGGMSYPATHNKSMKPILTQMAMRYLIQGNQINEGANGFKGLQRRKEKNPKFNAKDNLMYSALPTPGSAAAQEIKLMRGMDADMDLKGNKNQHTRIAKETEY